MASLVTSELKLRKDSTMEETKPMSTSHQVIQVRPCRRTLLPMLLTVLFIL